MLALLAAADAAAPPFDPFDKDHFDPGHFTASAVVLSPDRTAMLMIHHRGLDRWLQPGGHVEPGDADTLATAVREVREETGQDGLTPLGDPASHGLVDVDVHAIPANGDLPCHDHHDVRHAFLASRERLTPGSDVKTARWVPLSELTEWNDQPSIRRIAMKLTTLRGEP